MDQTIGIGYQVDGVSQVVKANNEVIGSFDKVVGKIQRVSSVVGALGGSFGALKSAMAGMGSGNIGAFFKGTSSLKSAATHTEAFKLALGGFPEKANVAAGSLNHLTSAVQRYNAAMSQAKASAIPMAPMTGTGSGKTGGGSAIHNRDIWSMTPRFMFAWRAGSEAIQAAQFGFNDILLGRSREKMAAGLGQLSPLGFDGELKAKTEQSAKLFSQRFWTVSSESYVAAMAQTASAFDVGRIGYKNLQQMNESAIKFSMVSKMTAEAASDLVQKSILAFMTGLPSDVAAKLNAGGIADVKGYGRVDLGGLSEKLSSQLAKTIAVSSIWGPGIQSGFRSALPTLVDKGWDLPSALALIGAFVDVGFQPGQGGRATKDIFEKEPAAMAKVLLWGTGNWQSESPQLDAQTLAHNKKVNRIHEEAVIPYVLQKLKDPTSAIELFGVLGQIVQKAESEGVDMNQFKFSKYFLPAIRQLIKKPMGERVQYLQKAIDSATPEEAARIAEQTMQDAGTAYQRITGAFQNLSTTMADSSWAHRIAKAVSTPMNFLDANLQFMKNTRGLAHDEMAAKYMEDEQQYIALFGQSQANLILKNAIAASKGQNVFEGGGFLGSMYQTTNELSSLWDNKFMDPQDMFTMSEEWKEYYRDFWNNGIIGPLKDAGATWDSYAQQVYAAMDYIPNKIVELFDMIGSAIDSVKAKVAPYMPKFESPPGQGPTPEGYNDMSLSDRMAVPFMSYGAPAMGAPPEITLTSHLDANLNLDGRILARAIAEVIQQNRDVHYHGFGGDPMGFVT